MHFIHDCDLHYVDMTDIRVTSVGDDAIEHHNPGIFSITVEPRFDWTHQRFGAYLMIVIGPMIFLILLL